MFPIPAQRPFSDKAPEEFLALTKRINLTFLEQRAAEHPELYEEQRRVVFAMGQRALDGQQEQKRQQFEDEYRRFLQEGPEEELLAVCHGDCHPNNILFQYPEGRESPKVALIDWQLSSLASPMRDLTFVLYACGSKEALSRAGELIRIYHASICRNLQEFGCNTDKVWWFYRKCVNIFTTGFSSHVRRGLPKSFSISGLIVAAVWFIKN